MFSFRFDFVDDEPTHHTASREFTNDGVRAYEKDNHPILWPKMFANE